MPRITPVHWKILECIFQKEGFIFERQTGSHRSYVKTGFHRPVVIPTYKEVDVEIIQRI
jgi:predicted RNA binding protein YcfA (HicA-like mRNA interferase family)